MAGSDEQGPLHAAPGPSVRHAPSAAPPRRRGGGFLSKLILAAILVIAVSFFTAPWFALQAVRSAAENRDDRALSELIDVNAVRQGLREQLSPAPANAATPQPSFWQTPLAAMRQALAKAAAAPSAPDVDLYLTPTALANLTYGRPANVPGTAKPWPKLRYWGFDRCRLAVPDPAHPGRETLFTFERHGLFTWKLSRIRLPDAKEG